MHKPRVLLVEDEDLPRQILHEELERREFEVWSAKDVTTAREFGRDLGGSLDVAVLDMRLEDPEYPGITGYDIGLEIRRQQIERSEWPSEVLFISMYPDVDYYQNALHLGAAGYLEKPQEPLEVIRHVRALALRGAVARDSQKNIRNIAGGNRSQSEAVSKFCREVLSEHLESTLGARFILLLSDGAGTRVCGGTFHEPDISPYFFDTLSGLAFSKLSSGGPFIVDPLKFPKLESSKERDYLNHLAGASVMSLAAGRDFRLMLGILQEDASQPLAENARLLAVRVEHYVRAEITSQLLRVAESWSDVDTARS